MADMELDNQTPIQLKIPVILIDGIEAYNLDSIIELVLNTYGLDL